MDSVNPNYIEDSKQERQPNCSETREDPNREARHYLLRKLLLAERNRQYKSEMRDQKQNRDA
jgi:hypothetical protein